MDGRKEDGSEPESEPLKRHRVWTPPRIRTSRYCNPQKTECAPGTHIVLFTTSSAHTSNEEPHKRTENNKKIIQTSFMQHLHAQIPILRGRHSHRISLSPFIPTLLPALNTLYPSSSEACPYIRPLHLPSYPTLMPNQRTVPNLSTPSIHPSTAIPRASERRERRQR